MRWDRQRIRENIRATGNKSTLTNLEVNSIFIQHISTRIYFYILLYETIISVSFSHAAWSLPRRHKIKYRILLRCDDPWNILNRLIRHFWFGWCLVRSNAISHETRSMLDASCWEIDSRICCFCFLLPRATRLAVRSLVFRIWIRNLFVLDWFCLLSVWHLSQWGLGVGACVSLIVWNYFILHQQIELIALSRMRSGLAWVPTKQIWNTIKL